MLFEGFCDLKPENRDSQQVWEEKYSLLDHIYGSQTQPVSLGTRSRFWVSVSVKDIDRKLVQCALIQHRRCRNPKQPVNINQDWSAAGTRLLLPPRDAFTPPRVSELWRWLPLQKVRGSAAAPSYRLASPFSYRNGCSGQRRSETDERERTALFQSKDDETEKKGCVCVRVC